MIRKIESNLGRLADVSKNNICEEWELFKQQIKIDAIERATKIKREERSEENGFRQDLQRLYAEEEKMPGVSGVFKDDISTVKTMLEKIDEERYKGAIVRARAENLIVGEMPTKRALRLKKKYVCENRIEEIEYRGAVTQDHDSIQHAFVEYYTHLFDKKIPKETGLHTEFLPNHPQLDSDTTMLLEEPISLSELEKAIDNLSIGKSPGTDGLTSAF